MRDNLTIGMLARTAVLLPGPYRLRCSWSIFQAPSRFRIVDAGHYVGATTRTDRQILEVADNVCASLRHDRSLMVAHSMTGRQLLLEGTPPRRWLTFVHAAIDNRCPDVDDAGLISED